MFRKKRNSLFAKSSLELLRNRCYALDSGVRQNDGVGVVGRILLIISLIPIAR